MNEHDLQELYQYRRHELRKNVRNKRLIQQVHDKRMARKSKRKGLSWVALLIIYLRRMWAWLTHEFSNREYYKPPLTTIHRDNPPHG